MTLVFLGSFASPLLAARAHDVAVLLCDGDASTLNFPADDYREVPYLRKRWSDKRLLRKAVCSATGDHLRSRYGTCRRAIAYMPDAQSRAHLHCRWNLQGPDEAQHGCVPCGEWHVRGEGACEGV